MISAKDNGYWAMEYLSNIELYYSETEKFSGNSVTINGDDFRHITKVMRHSTGDEIYVTNGGGKIFQSEISSVGKTDLTALVKKEYSYENKFRDITFCIPRLKNPDRFEFMIEKSVELGITNFLVFDSERAVAKTSRIQRWNKIALAAMKQSLRSYLPEIKEANSLKEVVKHKVEIILFEQNAEKNISSLKIVPGKKYFFIFGPEGGLGDEELKLVDKGHIYNLTENRLRTETAVAMCAAVLANK